MTEIVISSNCLADLNLVFSTFIHYSTNQSNRVILCTPSARHSHLIKSHFSLNGVILDNQVIITVSNDNDINTLIEVNDIFFLFTLGSKLTCSLAYRCIHLNKPIYYQDCYFDRAYLPERYQSPLLALLGLNHSSLCSWKTQLLQIVRQFIYDPFFTRYFFSADSHCWLTKKYVNRLLRMPPNILLLQDKKVATIPTRSIVFVLNSVDNDTLIPWEFFKALDFSCYYKPHPSVAQDYANYPSFIQPIYAQHRIEQIHFPSDSFLIGLTSNALSSTKQSISLCKLIDKEFNPLRFQYALKSRFLPTNLHDLLSILNNQ